MWAAATPVLRAGDRRPEHCARMALNRRALLARPDDLETGLAARAANSSRASAVRRVELEVAGDLPLPAVAVRQQPLLVVVELLAGLDGELDVRPLDDRV